jgi:hypothetical protein
MLHWDLAISSVIGSKVRLSSGTAIFRRGNFNALFYRCNAPSRLVLVYIVMLSLLIVLSMLDSRAHVGRQSFVIVLSQKMAFAHVSRIRPWQEPEERDRSRHWPSLVLGAEHHRTALVQVGSVSTRSSSSSPRGWVSRRCELAGWKLDRCDRYDRDRTFASSCCDPAHTLV